MLFQQRDAARHDWEAVRPGQKTDYAWDQPSGSHKLCVCIKDGSAAFRDMTTHEYGLDTVKVRLLPRILCAHTAAPLLDVLHIAHELLFFSWEPRVYG